MEAPFCWLTSLSIPFIAEYQAESKKSTLEF